MSKITIFILIIAISIIKAVLENKAKMKKAQQQQPVAPPVAERDDDDTYYEEEYEEEEQESYEPIMPDIQQPVHVPPVAVKPIVAESKATHVSTSFIEGERVVVKPRKKEDNYVATSMLTSMDLDVEEMRKAVIYSTILNRPNY